ncbi:MAG: hypothetical protein K9M96_10265 [Deltaproteobacteria bacterium]|nr:hypothetical protein [Deltaproteobacteria bacterium]
MKKRKRRIIPAEELIGDCDMSYDDELAEFEAAERSSILGGHDAFFFSYRNIANSTIQRPALLEHESDEYLSAALASLR